MLQAQNGRQLNLAANVIQSFFSKKDIQVKHSDALQLVSQLLGYPSYHAARASLQSAAKGMASKASTWRQLAHSIGTFDEVQLDLEVQVTSGWGPGGVATFNRATTVLLATDDRIAHGAPAFPNKQPILMVEELAAGREEEPMDDDSAENEYRVGMQLECATDEDASLAGWHIERKGLEDAIDYLNSEYGCNISLGKYVAYSENERGFWNSDAGFVYDKASATGFDSAENLPDLAGITDLEMVLYSEAVDVDPDKEDTFADQVRGKPISRYQWPVQYARLWEEVSPRISELLEATKKLVEAKSFTGQIFAREHVDGTGEQLVLELYSGAPDAGNAVFGGRLVFALADFQRSGVVNAAGLGVFLEIPGREPSLAYSLNIERRGEAPFATEASYFFEELLHQTPQKLASELMLHANFEHGLSTD